MKNYNTTPVLDEQEFRDHKKFQLPIIDKYQYFNEKKAHTMIDCGRFLWFGLYQNKQDFSEKKKLENMYTCKDRFCPFCNWRRARKLAIQTYDVISSIETDCKARYNFLTLTTKNVRIEDVSNAIKHMNKSFEKLSRNVRFKNSVIGWSRILEYPPQKDNAEFINLHFHCVLVVKPEYFDTKYDFYISSLEWQKMWRNSLGVDYDPSVDIRIMKQKGNDPIAKLVSEFAKYPLKSVDLVALSIKQFQELVSQMKYKRTIAFGGIMKDHRKKLQLDDVEDGDLIYDSLENKEVWTKIAELAYQYEKGNFGLDYYFKDMKILKDDDVHCFNGN